MHSALQYFLIYSSFIVLVPFVAASVRYNKIQRPLSYLAILIFADFFSELIIHILFFLKMKNQFLWPFFISVEFGLLTWIYRYESRPRLIARIAPVIIFLFVCYVFGDWFSHGRAGLSAVPHFAEGVIILYYALSFFYKTLKNPVAIHLEREPMFWLSTGLFIYFSGNSVIFIFSNYLQSFSEHFNNQVWLIHAILNIVLYLFYTLAICLTPKKRISSN